MSRHAAFNSAGGGVLPAVGDLVVYRPALATGVSIMARVTRVGAKDGRALAEFDNGTWAYCDEILRLVERHDYESRVRTLEADGMTRSRCAGHRRCPGWHAMSARRLFEIVFWIGMTVTCCYIGVRYTLEHMPKCPELNSCDARVQP